jgi:DNA replication protein DnaC
MIYKKKEMFLKLRDKLYNDCNKCNHTGWINDYPCECSRKLEYYIGLDEAGVDREYWTLTFNDWKGDEVAKNLVVSYLEKLDNAYDKGVGIVLWGNHGTGKTMLSSFILKKAMISKRSIRFITMGELTDLFRRKIEDKEAEIFYEDKVKNVDFLCIDNLGSEYVPQTTNNTYTLSQYDTLARHRKRNLLPTILTTNLDQGDFIRQYGPAVSSLYSGCSIFIKVNGLDFRSTINSMEKLI